MTKRMRVLIVPTKRTDLTCIYCGAFRTEFAIVGVGPPSGFFQRTVTPSEESAHAGVHRKCAKLNRPVRRRRSSPDDGDPGNNPVRSGPEE